MKLAFLYSMLLIIYGLSLQFNGKVRASDNPETFQSLNRIPIGWNSRVGSYTKLDGKPVDLESDSIKIIAPYPNVIWDSSKKCLATLDGNLLTPIKNQAGQMVIPIEAIDPYIGLNHHAGRIKNFESDQGKKQGKIPIYYDPVRRGYFDDKNNRVAIWNKETYELVQPLPNVFWNLDEKKYVTRDGGLLPWIENRRNWDGVSVADVNFSNFGSEQDHDKTQAINSKDTQKPLANLQQSVIAYQQFSQILDVARKGQSEGKAVPPQLIETLGQMQSMIRRQWPGSIKQVLASENSSQVQQPKRKLHISERPDFEGNRLQASEVFASKNSMAAMSHPGFSSSAYTDMVNLNQEEINAINKGGISDAEAANFTSRFISISQRLLNDMNGYISRYDDVESWNRMSSLQEASARMMQAAQTGKIDAMSASAEQMLNALPESVASPVKAYFEKCDVLYNHTQITQDSIDDYSNVDDQLAKATAQMFADLIHKNPEISGFIAGEVARIDKVNKTVNEWSIAERRIVESYFRQSEDAEILMWEATGLGGLDIMPEVSLKYGGTLFPDSPAVYLGASLSYGTIRGWVQERRDERARRYAADDGWFDNHLLSVLITQQNTDLDLLFGNISNQ